MSKSFASEIRIGHHVVGVNHPPYIVAELSGNHRGSLENALKLVEAAKASGAQAVKLQTYTPDTITLDVKRAEFIINDPESAWHGRSLYDLYTEAHMPWDWHAPIFQRCRELGLTAFSTPFDETAVDFLESLDVPCYKIASLEIVDLPLIRKVAATRKPMILSTGSATEEEIGEAVEAARDAGCHQLVLLKCTTSYPADPRDSNLAALSLLANLFQTPVGLSDHTLGIGAAIASVALGGCLVEKHFTHSRQEGGVDAAFSMEPAELATLVVETKRAWESLGTPKLNFLPSEATIRALRPSLYLVEDVEAGTTIQSHHVRSLRPAGGLPPKCINQILGQVIQVNCPQGTPISRDLFNNLNL